MDHAAEYYWYDFVAQNVNENLTHYFYPITSNAKKIFSLEDFGLSLPVRYPISLLFFDLGALLTFLSFFFLGWTSWEADFGLDFEIGE